MKKTLLFVLSTLMILSMAAACGKKKDEKKAADAPAMGAEKAPEPADAMKEAAKPEPPKPEPAKPEPAPEPAAGTTPPTVTALAELGTPMIAVRVDLAKVFASPVFQATGLEEKMNQELMDDEDFDRVAVSACIGMELKKVSELVTSISVFGSGEKDLVILADTPVESEKLFNCVKEASKKKKNRLTEMTYGAVKGFKVTAKDGDVTHLVPVGKNRVLFLIGEHQVLVGKLKVGEGHLGKGEVDGYFPGGPQVVKVVLRNLPLEKMNKPGGAFQIPNLKSGDLDGTIHLDEGFSIDVRLDAKDPKAAESLIAMGTLMKGLDQVRDEMKEIGLDGALLDEVKLAAKGPVASLRVVLDAARAKAVAAVLKKQLLD